jgi:hypothetical protein
VLTVAGSFGDGTPQNRVLGPGLRRLMMVWIVSPRLGGASIA